MEAKDKKESEASRAGRFYSPQVRAEERAKVLDEIQAGTISIAKLIEKARQEGMKEGIRRAYEDMKALHRIADYDLDACVTYLESVYGKPSSKNGDYDSV